MDIYIIGDNAFIVFDRNHLLCVGSKEEVLEATDQQRAELVLQSLAICKFGELTAQQRAN